MSALINSDKLKKAVALTLALAPLALIAQNAATPAPAAPADTMSDSTLYIMIGIMAVLLFAIGILGSVMLKLAQLMVDKSKTRIAAVIALLLMSGSLFAENAPAAQSGGSGLAANWNMIMASTVLIAMLFTIVVLLLRIRKMLDYLSDKKEVATEPVFEVQFPKFLDNFNASVSIEKEKDILLDHNYDGIQELDNNLPPWWKYSFYLSIIFAICYLSYYHILGGPSSHDEYDKAVAQAQVQQEEYNRANAGKVDENNIMMADASGLDEGKTLFMANCQACHRADAGGLVGPNLTDDYWLHGGSLNDIFKTIKNGYPAKGMKAWQTDLSPVQIKNVVGYIKTLRGSNPVNPKAPQGDLYAEPGAKPAAVDSSVVKEVDSTKVKSI